MAGWTLYNDPYSANTFSDYRHGIVYDITNTSSAPLPLSPSVIAPSTGVNPNETSYALYGHIIPLLVLGQGRIGGDIISGPWHDGTSVSGINSFGVQADPTRTLTLVEVAFDSEVVWQGSQVGNGTLSSAGFFTEPITMRFYTGSLTQPADSLETSHFGSNAVAYRGQVLLAIDNLPLANTKFKKYPYIAAKLLDQDGATVNFGTLFERLAYSPYVGYTSAQFETSGITDGVVDGGFIIVQDMDFLTLLQQFGRFYPTWSILQTDKLRIVDRGSNVTPDLVVNRQTLTGDLTVSRQGPDTVKKDLELSTIDPGSDYTIITSRAQRPRDPVAVTTSVGVDSAYLPVVMDASTREAIVTLAKYHEEQSRKTVSGAAMAYGLELEPGDLVAVTAIGSNFENEIYKVVETLHGTNNVVEFTAAAFLKCQVTLDDAGDVTAPSTLSAWNSADKSVGITLTNSDLTASQSASITGGVRSTTGHTTGKYYIEFSVGAFTGNLFDDDSIGVATLAAALSTITYSGSFSIRNDGLMRIGGVTTAKSVNSLANNVIGIALDLDHQRVWVRNSGNGNTWVGTSNLTNDPATNTNGFNISGVFSGVAAYLFLGTDSTATEIVTINDIWTYAAPSGFIAW